MPESRYRGPLQSIGTVVSARTEEDEIGVRVSARVQPSLEVAIELEGEAVYSWLQANDLRASWAVSGGTLWIAGPGALSLSPSRGRVEFYLGRGASPAPDSIRAAEMILAAIRELPESHLLLACDVAVRVRRRR